MAWGAVGRNNELRWETTCFVLRKKINGKKYAQEVAVKEIFPELPLMIGGRMCPWSSDYLGKFD